MTKSTLSSVALLLLRVVLGITFLRHGLDKLGNLSGTEQFFDSLGIPAAGLMAPLVAVTETVGGALLILGLLTPLAGLALAVDMTSPSSRRTSTRASSWPRAATSWCSSSAPPRSRWR